MQYECCVHTKTGCGGTAGEEHEAVANESKKRARLYHI